MKFSRILIMSLLAFLPTSSFFLSDYLTEQINSNLHSEAQFNFALVRNNKAALTLISNQAEVGSKPWLKAKQALAQHNSIEAFTLGQWYIARYQALTSSSTKQEQSDYERLGSLWLEQAIRLGNQQAVFALSQFYYHQGLLAKAKQKLEPIQSLTPEAFILKIKLAIDLGESDFLNVHAEEIKQRLGDSSVGEALLAQLKRYAIVTESQANLDSDKSIFAHQANICSTSIQLFATRLTDLAYADKLIQAFSQQPLASFVCFAVPKYIPKHQIHCDINDNHAILCDESDWQSVASTIKTRHTALLLPRGGANVHYGILYLAADDDVDVFHHEVSHLLGFADEYPLKKLHEKCLSEQGAAFAYNIAVLAKHYIGRREVIRGRIEKQIPWASYIKPSTPILTSVKGKPNHWQLATPSLFENEVGVFLSKTCNNSESAVSNGFAAYKPSANITQLEYFEKGFPDLYLQMLSNDTARFLMPSFHYNIAFAAYNRGKIKQANYWLAQAAKWEQSPQRKSKVLAGSY